MYPGEGGHRYERYRACERSDDEEEQKGPVVWRDITNAGSPPALQTTVSALERMTTDPTLRSRFGKTTLRDPRAFYERFPYRMPSSQGVGGNLVDQQTARGSPEAASRYDRDVFSSTNRFTDRSASQKASLAFILDRHDAVRGAEQNHSEACLLSSTTSNDSGCHDHSKKSAAPLDAVAVPITRAMPLTPPAALSSADTLCQSGSSGRPPDKVIKKSRICKMQNCTRYVVNKGLCIGHGGGKRCAVAGCTSSAKNLGVCWKHGGSTKCTVDGCENRAKSRGVCWSHGGGRRCKDEGCAKTAVSNGLCWAHGGGKRCSIDGCKKPAYERNGNLCARHAATDARSASI